MKRLLTVFCVVSMLVFFCSSALAAPSISVTETGLSVSYKNAEATSKFTYVLLDDMERIALVEIDAGPFWNPDWTEEGLYKVQVYYKDKAGTVQRAESDYLYVHFEKQVEPLDWDTFQDDNNDPLPSNFGHTVEYIEPTPMPTQAPITTSSPQVGTPVYTFAPSQPAASTSEPVVVYMPTATSAPAYPGTRPCFEHLNIRIRISDNSTHMATVGRSGPGTEMPQVATLNIGEVYQVLDCRIVEEGNVHWFMINKDGVNCWVAAGRCERY